MLLTGMITDINMKIIINILIFIVMGLVFIGFIKMIIDMIRDKPIK
jgi:hypothetical protein